MARVTRVSTSMHHMYLRRRRFFRWVYYVALVCSICFLSLRMTKQEREQYQSRSFDVDTYQPQLFSPNQQAAVPNQQAVSNQQAIPNQQVIPNQQAIPNQQIRTNQQPIVNQQIIPNQPAILNQQIIPNQQAISNQQVILDNQPIPGQQGLSGEPAFPNSQPLVQSSNQNNYNPIYQQPPSNQLPPSNQQQNLIEQQPGLPVPQNSPSNGIQNNGVFGYTNINAPITAGDNQIQDGSHQNVLAANEFLSGNINSNDLQAAIIQSDSVQSLESLAIAEDTGDMHFISVVCVGEDLESSVWQKRQLNVLLKSMVWFGTRHIHFHLFSDNPLFFTVAQNYINTWPPNYQQRITISTHEVWYPESMKSMKMTFRPCSSQRLFLPGLLPNISKAIYLDTDLIFFRPIDELWRFMITEMKPHYYGGFGPRMLAVTDARLLYYGRREVNAGLFFMNLDKLRQFPGTWEGEVQRLFFSQKFRDTLGRDPDDQDILNFITTAYSDRFYNLSCEWNYRFFMCENTNGDKCEDAQRNGISIFHGLGHSFFNCTKAPKFCTVFSIIENYKLGQSLRENVYNPVQNALERISAEYKKGYRCKNSVYFNPMVMQQFIKYIS